MHPGTGSKHANRTGSCAHIQRYYRSKYRWALASPICAHATKDSPPHTGVFLTPWAVTQDGATVHPRATLILPALPILNITFPVHLTCYVLMLVSTALVLHPCPWQGSKTWHAPWAFAFPPRNPQVVLGYKTKMKMQATA